MARLYPVRAQFLAASLFALTIFLCVSASPLLAEQVKPQSSQPKSQGVKAGVQGTPTKPAKPVMPDDTALVRLICSTVIALNQANATGNYSVFRELSAPGFQVANSTGQLSETFAKLRSHNFDLSAVILLPPKLLAKPEIDATSMLRLTGFFPTEPERLNFDLMYQFVGGQWRLFGIAIDTAAIKPATAQSVPQPSTPEAMPADSSAPAPAAPNAAKVKPAAKQSDIRDRVDFLEAGIVAPPRKPVPRKDDMNPF